MDKVGLDLIKLCTCGPGDAPCHGDGGPWLPLQGGHHLGVREPTASQWHLGSEGAPYVVYGVHFREQPPVVRVRVEQEINLFRAIMIALRYDHFGLALAWCLTAGLGADVPQGSVGIPGSAPPLPSLAQAILITTAQ
jgi:hypothetical protein